MSVGGWGFCIVALLDNSCQVRGKETSQGLPKMTLILMTAAGETVQVNKGQMISSASLQLTQAVSTRQGRCAARELQHQPISAVAHELRAHKAEENTPSDQLQPPTSFFVFKLQRCLCNLRARQSARVSKAADARRRVGIKLTDKKDKRFT